MKKIMNNKVITTVIIIIIIIAGAYYLLSGSETTQEKPSQVPSGTTLAPAEQDVVTYTDTGYSPSALKVKVGTTVTFKNESTQAMWTASAMHPTHTVYPTTGGCIGSTFDACKGIQPSENWSFKFDIAGTWKYHNHMNPSHFGAIVVE